MKSVGLVEDIRDEVRDVGPVYPPGPIHLASVVSSKLTNSEMEKSCTHTYESVFGTSGSMVEGRHKPVVYATAEIKAES